MIMNACRKSPMLQRMSVYFKELTLYYMLTFYVYKFPARCFSPSLATRT
jgi:hypothetical protein